MAKELDATLSGELLSLADALQRQDRDHAGRSTLGRIPSRRIIFAGLGPVESFGEATVTRMAGAAVRAGRDAGARRIAVAVPETGIGARLLTALEAAAVGRFTRALSLR